VVDAQVMRALPVKVSLLYVELPKNSGNLTIKNVLTITPSSHRLHRSRPLGHVYSDLSVFPMISYIPGISQM